MIAQSMDRLLGLAAGSLLALMIYLNSKLASKTSALFSAWSAHATGTIAALLIVLLFNKRELNHKKLKPWFYLGGIPGTFTVILAAIAINLGLSLSGSIAWMLFGQVLFGTLSDHFGWFALPRRKFGLGNLFVMGLILIGSLLIVFGKEGHL